MFHVLDLLTFTKISTGNIIAKGYIQGPPKTTFMKDWIVFSKMCLNCKISCILFFTSVKKEFRILSHIANKF